MKILIQFDGSNFYKKVKKIAPELHLTNFDYSKFSKNISGSEKINQFTTLAKLKNLIMIKNLNLYIQDSNHFFPI